jgi:hypothetical protein
MYAINVEQTMMIQNHTEPLQLIGFLHKPLLSPETPTYRAGGIIRNSATQAMSRESSPAPGTDKPMEM